MFYIDVFKVIGIIPYRYIILVKWNIKPYFSYIRNSLPKLIIRLFYYPFLTKAPALRLLRLEFKAEKFIYSPHKADN